MAASWHAAVEPDGPAKQAARVTATGALTRTLARPMGTSTGSRRVPVQLIVISEPVQAAADLVSEPVRVHAGDVRFGSPILMRPLSHCYRRCARCHGVRINDRTLTQ